MSPEPTPINRSARAREFRRILAEMLRIDRVRGGLVVSPPSPWLPSRPPSGANSRWARTG